MVSLDHQVHFYVDEGWDPTSWMLYHVRDSSVTFENALSVMVLMSGDGCSWSVRSRATEGA